MHPIAAGTVVLTLALVLGGCQEERRPTVSLDDAMRTTAQLRISAEGGPGTTAAPGAAQSGSLIWREGDGGQSEIEIDIAEDTPLMARARAIVNRIAAERLSINSPQILRLLDEAEANLGGIQTRAADDLRRRAARFRAFALNDLGRTGEGCEPIHTAKTLHEKLDIRNNEYISTLRFVAYYCSVAGIAGMQRAEAAVTTAEQAASRIRYDARFPWMATAYRFQIETMRAVILQAKRERAAAIGAYQNALSILGQMIDREIVGNEAERYKRIWRQDAFGLMARTATLQASLGLWRESEASRLEALRLAVEFYGRRSRVVADQLLSLGDVYYRFGRPREREAALRDAAEIMIALDRDRPTRRLAEALDQHARALGDIGERRAALARFEEALKVYAIVAPDHVMSTTVWPRLLIENGRVEEAIDYANRQYAIYGARAGIGSLPEARWRGLRAAVLQYAGRNEEAVAEFSKATGTLFSSVRGTTDAETGSAAEDSDLRFIGNTHLNALRRYAIARLPIERFHVADSFLVAERLRQGASSIALSHAAARRVANDSAIEDLFRRQQNAALERSRLLRRVGELARFTAGDAERRELAEARLRIQELTTAQTIIEAEIARRNPQLARLGERATPTVEDVSAILAPNEIAISYYVANNSVYGWAMRRDAEPGFFVARLPARQIGDLVKRVRKPMDTPISSLGDIAPFDVEAAHELYLNLIKPVERMLQGADTLIVAPHGQLLMLPFQMLLSEPVRVDADKEVLFDRYKGLPFLINKVGVAHLPSISALGDLRRDASRPAPRPFIGFGDPLFNPRQQQEAQREATRTAEVATRSLDRIMVRAAAAPNGTARGLAGLPRLPETAEEVRAIAGILKADPAKDLFLGLAATEANVRRAHLRDSRVVVFATHGLIPGDLPGLTQPALAMTAPELTQDGGDGLLTVDNILGLDLNAEWVVLSACNTGGGDGQSAEAVSGLGRAFFYAGARAVMVTNWAVETTSAQRITTKTFEVQTAAGVSRGEAFRRSMVSLAWEGEYVDSHSGKRVFSYAHPMFWAPCSLYGDPGGNTLSSSRM